MRYRNPQEKLVLSGKMFDNPLDHKRNSHTGFLYETEERWFSVSSGAMTYVERDINRIKPVNVKKVLKQIKNSQIDDRPDQGEQIDLEDLINELERLESEDI